MTGSRSRVTRVTPTTVDLRFHGDLDRRDRVPEPFIPGAAEIPPLTRFLRGKNALAESGHWAVLYRSGVAAASALPEVALVL